MWSEEGSSVEEECKRREKKLTDEEWETYLSAFYIASWEGGRASSAENNRLCERRNVPAAQTKATTVSMHMRDKSAQGPQVEPFGCPQLFAIVEYGTDRACVLVTSKSVGHRMCRCLDRCARRHVYVLSVLIHVKEHKRAIMQGTAFLDNCGFVQPRMLSS